jgi:hypothetical protein|tara:strand:+ start:213 stop:329 length:117 start_codon:yes stop_codon:yes gene_type:complete
MTFSMTTEARPPDFLLAQKRASKQMACPRVEVEHALVA